MVGSSELPHASPAPPLLVVISGPSASGKSSVVSGLRQLERPWHFAVTATTRPQRSGEVDGRDYIFLEVETFLRMRERDELLESAQVYDRWYGVPRQQVRDPLIAGKDVILGIDVQGAATIRQIAPEALTIFVMPASLDELSSRLSGRGTEGAAEMQRRLDEASVELARIAEFDYRVVNRNGELDATVHEVDAIIAAEKCRVNPRLVQFL
ncbi:Guanylate kinase [Geodia barretti]|uniref:guanylate kinase n=1 Tax=Geodia barretti TaxID=519541 RepID=A0AA35T6Q5_GEOBA|nr:Guanylate kinase [Geodia barretti]